MRQTDKINLKLKGATGELYLIDDSTECPCMDVYGQYSPEWHDNNPLAEQCENGYLNEWTHETVYFKIIESEFSTETRPQGLLPKNSLRLFGFVNSDLEEIDLSDINRTNSYLLIDSDKYLITGISKEFIGTVSRNVIDIELCSL